MSITELQEQAKLNNKINLAYANIKQVDPVINQQVIADTESSNVVIALNNLRKIANETVARNIVDSLRGDENRINYLNKYFVAFKNSLPNNRVISLGDFQKRFGDFYIQDVGRTNQPMPEIIKRSIIIKNKYSIDELMNMSKREIDENFRYVYKKKMDKDVEVGDSITYITTTGKESEPVNVKDITGYVIFTLSGKARNSENIKMRYIYKEIGQKNFAELTDSENRNFRWNGLATEGSGLQSGFGMQFPKSRALKKKLALSKLM